MTTDQNSTFGVTYIKMKRLIFLYFSGIQINPVYVPMINIIDEFFKGHKEIIIDDPLYLKVLCRLDKNDNILFAYPITDNSFKSLIFSKFYENKVFEIVEAGLDLGEYPTCLNAVTLILAEKNNVGFRHWVFHRPPNWEPNNPRYFDNLYNLYKKQELFI